MGGRARSGRRSRRGPEPGRGGAIMVREERALREGGSGAREAEEGLAEEEGWGEGFVGHGFVVVVL